MVTLNITSNNEINTLSQSNVDKDYRYFVINKATRYKISKLNSKTEKDIVNFKVLLDDTYNITNTGEDIIIRPILNFEVSQDIQVSSQNITDVSINAYKTNLENNTSLSDSEISDKVDLFSKYSTTWSFNINDKTNNLDDLFFIDYYTGNITISKDVFKAKDLVSFYLTIYCTLETKVHKKATETEREKTYSDYISASAIANINCTITDNTIKIKASVNTKSGKSESKNTTEDYTPTKVVINNVTVKSEDLIDNYKKNISSEKSTVFIVPNGDLYEEVSIDLQEEYLASKFPNDTLIIMERNATAAGIDKGNNYSSHTTDEDTHSIYLIDENSENYITE